MPKSAGLMISVVFLPVSTVLLREHTSPGMFFQGLLVGLSKGLGEYVPYVVGLASIALA